MPVNGGIYLSKIIVAGAGHGGIVAAMHLAKEGHSVTIYEKSSEAELGLLQVDAFDTKAMDYAGIPVPEKFRAQKNRITFVPLDKNASPITLPASDDNTALSADRKELVNYLLSLAREAGVKVVFDCETIAPIVLGSRVAGIKTTMGDFFGDLIIDAAGLHSPLRMQLPDFMCIQKELPTYDVIHTYRAYFNRVEGVPEPATNYNIYIKHDGTVGFSWLVTEKEDVDVLIVRFHEISDEDILSSLKELHEENPHMGTTLLKKASYHDIPVRQPLAVFVADGYAAVGDSACMTYPIKGSGISYCLKAGTILANAVKEDKDGLYNAETLWNYEHNFYKEIGFDACRLAVLKTLLPYVTAQEVSDIFEAKIITTDELVMLSSDSLGTLLNKKGLAALKDRVKLLNDFPESKKKLLNMLLWFGKVAVTEPFFPQKYDRKDVMKWNEKLNEAFCEIAFKDEPEITDLF